MYSTNELCSGKKLYGRLACSCIVGLVVLGLLLAWPGRYGMVVSSMAMTRELASVTIVSRAYQRALKGARSEGSEGNLRPRDEM